MKSRPNSFLIFLIVLFHAASFIYQVYNRNIYLSDSYEYLQQADNISEKGIIYCGDTEKPLNKDLFTKRPLMYSLFINAVKSLHRSDLTIIFFQNLLSLLNIFLIASLSAKLLFGSKKTLLLFFIFSPVQFLYANMIMSEILFQTLLILILLIFIKFSQKPRAIYFLWISVLLIFSMMTKPVMYLFSIALLLTGVFYAYRIKNIKIGLYAIIPLIFVFAYSYWNLQRTGYYHFSSIQNINLVNYNTYFFLNKAKGQDKANEIIRSINAKASKIENYAEKQKFLRSSATSIIWQNRTDYFIFHATGMLRFFIDPGRFDFFNFFGIEKEGDGGFLYILNQQGFASALKYFFNLSPMIIVVMLIVLVFNIAKSVGLMLFFLLDTVRIETRIALGVIIFYLAVATGPLGASRFMLPVLPFIILAASVSLTWVKQYRGYRSASK